MKVSIDIKIDYTINPIFIMGIFNRIDYKFKLNDITLVKGILTEYDIITTLPYLESINADYFTIVSEHITSGIIAEIYEKLGIEINSEGFIKENIDMLKNFISELRTNVKDIQIMLSKKNNKTNKKKDK